MSRYLITNFETNGRPCGMVRPTGAFPTQVSVDACDPATSEVRYLYDPYIQGAESLSEWVCKNTPATFTKLRKAPKA